MSKPLIIVESPTKAKTISRFLGGQFIVKASMGHVRDLPKSKLSIDVKNDFEPVYVIPPKAKEVIAELKKDAKGAPSIILATDEDREGEAISWHLVQALGLGDEAQIAKGKEAKTPLHCHTFDFSRNFVAEKWGKVKNVNSNNSATAKMVINNSNRAAAFIP